MVCGTLSRVVHFVGMSPSDQMEPYCLVETHKDSGTDRSNNYEPDKLYPSSKSRGLHLGHRHVRCLYNYWACGSSICNLILAHPLSCQDNLVLMH